MAKNPVASVRTMDETRKAELYKKLDDWHRAKHKAAEWGQKEMELRKEIFSEYFPDAVEGTNTLTLEFGKALKANRVISRSIVKAELEALVTVERAKVDATGMCTSNILPLLDDVVVYEPKLSVSEWKKLPEESRKLLADVVTIKDGAPTLSIETPKT